MKCFAWRILFLLLLLVLAVGGQQAQAKKNSSSFSSGGKVSSSSSSTKSSGWSNSSSAPAAPAAAPRQSAPATGWSNSAPQTAKPQPQAAPAPAQTLPGKPATGGSWGNSTGASTTPAAESTRPKSSFSSAGQTAIQKDASLKAYNDYKGKFAKPENPVNPSSLGTVPAPQPTRTWDNYRDYRDYRDNYYSGRGWNPPGYAYRSFPSFGLWDAMFLWFMLRQASGPSFMYNHQSDPGVQAFRQEADKLAASNADLKKQLTDLDAKVDQMKKNGVPVDPKQLPEGVDPAVALAAEKVVKENPAVKSSGGGTWLWIAGAGLAVAVVFLLLSSRRGRNTRN